MPILYIDDAGIHAMREDEILAFLQSSYKGIYGADIDVSTATPDGQWLGTLAELFSEVNQVAVQVYNARAPGGATGAALARLVTINGLKKKDPAFSTGTVTLTGTVGAPIPAGTRIGNVQPGVNAIFETTEDVVIGGGSTVDVGIQSTVAGPIPGEAGDLTVILTVVPGLASVINAADVALGDTGETDAQLRARRAASVALPSQGILDGLEATLLQLPNVTQAVVRENPEDTTQTLADGGTLAPHAIQAIVLNGDDDDIANAIWVKRSLGCTMIGAVVVSVDDVQGTPHDVKFDRPIDVPIYVKVNTPTALSSDEKTAVQNAIVSRGIGELSINGKQLPASQIGNDIHVSQIYQAITYLQLTSMPNLEVDEIDISTTPGPTSEASISISYLEIATWDPTHITFAP